jgi:WD40 repeat protein
LEIVVMKSKLTKPCTLASVIVAWLTTVPLQVFAQEPTAEFEFGTQRVHSVVFSPEGKLLAGGNFGGQIRVWNVEEQKEVMTFAAHELEIRLLEFINGGKTLLSVDADGGVKLWDVANWKEQDSFFTATTYAGAISPDGKQIVIGGFGKASSYELAGGKGVQQFKHDTAAFGVAFTPDGKLLVTASEASVKLWDFAKGQQLALLPYSGGGNLRGLVMTPDGSYLAAWEEQKFVRVWDVGTRKALKPLTLGVADIIKSVVFSPDNKTLAVGSEINLTIFDAASGKQLKKWEAAVDETLVYSPNGSLLAAGGMTVESKGKVQLWTVAKPLAKSGTEPVSQSVKPATGKKPASVARIWTSANRKYKVRASLVRVVDGKAHLKREDNGKIIVVPVDQLSEQDRKLLRGS